MKLYLLALPFFLFPVTLLAGFHEEAKRVYGESLTLEAIWQQQIADKGEEFVKNFWLDKQIASRSGSIRNFAEQHCEILQRLSYYLLHLRNDKAASTLTYWLDSHNDTEIMREKYEAGEVKSLLDIVLLIVPLLEHSMGSAFLTFWVQKIDQQVAYVSQLNKLAENNFYCARQVALQVFFNQEFAANFVDYWASHHNFIDDVMWCGEPAHQTLVALLPLSQPAKRLQYVEWVKRLPKDRPVFPEALLQQATAMFKHTPAK